MGSNSAIAWTDHTWNPWIGCRKVSDGCKNCYMYRDQRRWNGDPTDVHRTSDRSFLAPIAKNKNGFYKWKPGSRVFVCSWSDFFIEEADPWRQQAWEVMEERTDITFLILTKRVERMNDFYADRTISKWSPKVWQGISVEDNDTAIERVEAFNCKTVARTFISYEPAIGSVNWLDVWAYRFDWVIVGGESGPNSRPMNPYWIESTIEWCQRNKIPFFMKQMGGWPDKQDRFEQIPEPYRIRQYPA